MPDPQSRPVTAVDFALRLADLGLIPDLTRPQATYLEALDGTRAPLSPAVRLETARAAGRRLLRDIVAAHTIAIGHPVSLVARDERDAARARDEIVALAAAYLASRGPATSPGPPPDPAPLLRVFAPRHPDSQEAPTCRSSASSAPPAPPPTAPSCAAPAAPRR